MSEDEDPKPPRREKKYPKVKQSLVCFLVTWIYIAGTCPSRYPVRTVTRSPTSRVYSKPNMKAQDVKIGIVIVG